MKGILLPLFVGILSLQIALSQIDGPVVDTDYGPIRGFHSMDRLNRTYDGFLGVPFAKPPVGVLRWKPSEAPDAWEDVLNTTEYSDHCIQPISSVYALAGLGGNDSEDCLYLNVFVPVSVENALDRNLPVMVFYYGGGFSIGTTEMYPGEELATTGDVVVVTVNYRISVMGFLSTGDAAAPGNYGLWDAKTSLDWINNNIGYFGGDASRITIFGQSAGGFLVSHCMLSPQTNQLFQRAIPMSGAAGYRENPKATAQYLGDLFNCSTTDSQEIVDCLMDIDGKELDSLFYISIVLDDFSPTLHAIIDGTFVTQDPRESWKQGVGSDLDILSGYTYHDSAGFVVGNLLALPLNRSDDGNKNNTELYDYLSNDFGTYDNLGEILETIYDRYPEMNNTEPAVASEWVTRFKTDFDFASPTFYQVEKHAEAQGTGSAYLYEFRHRHSFLDAYPAWVNGSHLDDIYSVLGEAFFKSFRETWLENGEYSEEDSQLSEIIIQYYANFAYTGNPNSGPFVMDVAWPEYDLTNRQYMIETPTPIVQSHSQEMLDDYNWLLYDLWGMLRPEWGAPLGFMNKEFILDYLMEIILEE